LTIETVVALEPVVPAGDMEELELEPDMEELELEPDIEDIEDMEELELEPDIEDIEDMEELELEPDIEDIEPDIEDMGPLAGCKVNFINPLDVCVFLLTWSAIPTKSFLGIIT
jgi:hypothetical protein